MRTENQIKSKLNELTMQKSCCTPVLHSWTRAVRSALP